MEFTLTNLRLNGFLGMNIVDMPLWLYILALVAAAVAAYFLGSLNFGVIISKYKFHEDIRSYGSGNAGMTNMLRTYGKAAAAFTLLGDGIKAAVSVLIGTLLIGVSGAYIAGLFCIVGHAFPIYYGFKGGKGVVVSAVTILCLEPLVFLPLFILFLAIVATTRYISLGSIMGMFVFPLLLNRLYPALHNGDKAGAIVTVASILMSVMVIWLHRSNIKRLWEGKENKLSFKKKDKKKLDGTAIAANEGEDAASPAETKDDEKKSETKAK